MRSGNDVFNLNQLKQTQYEKAKLYWVLANILGILIILLGFTADFWPFLAPLCALVATIFTVIVFLLQLFSDNAKDTGEWVLRQFEMWDGIGWPIDKKALSDILVHISNASMENLYLLDDRKYFDSNSNTSPKRLVQNVMQSAFYTKHLAFYIAKIIFAIAATIFATVMFTAIVNLQHNFLSTNQDLSYTLLIAIQLVIATGYLRLGVEYWRFGQYANAIEDRACEMDRGSIEVAYAVQLAHDYQIIRSKLPLIPSWAWKTKEARLNELWDKFRN